MTSQGDSAPPPLERFLTQLTVSQTAHLRELQTVWKEMEEAVAEALKSGYPTPSVDSDLDALKRQRQGLRSHFLEAPLQRLEATQPHRRALLAL